MNTERDTETATGTSIKNDSTKKAEKEVDSCFRHIS